MKSPPSKGAADSAERQWPGFGTGAAEELSLGPGPGRSPWCCVIAQRWPPETGPPLPRLPLEEAGWRPAWRNPDLEPPKLSVLNGMAFMHTMLTGGAGSEALHS